LYRNRLIEYRERFGVTKAILLGGEPTLHPLVGRFVQDAVDLGFMVTVYSNGARLNALDGLVGPKVTVRIGVLGYERSEKPLAKIPAPKYPVSIVYMLRRDNVDELGRTVKDAEERFDTSYFMLSSIRDIQFTGSYWKDTEDTIPNEEYQRIVVGFLGRYRGRLAIHAATRGVFPGCGHDTCRFINVYPDGGTTLCPFDISLGIRDDPSVFGRKCGKHHECLLQKQMYTKTAL
jgi:MoaA/NifB/PqqE/SkfB family radical SAM enzyme